MARVRKRTTAKKALQTFATYAVAIGTAMTQVEIPDGDLSDKALITVGLSTLFAVARAINNVRKRRRAEEPVKTYVDYRNLTVAMFVALSLGLAGCIATQAKDGSWTVEVDRSALNDAWDRYETLERRQTDLEREREQASPERVKAITRELEALEPEIVELGEVLGVKLPAPR